MDLGSNILTSKVFALFCMSFPLWICPIYHANQVHNPEEKCGAPDTPWGFVHDDYSSVLGKQVPTFSLRREETVLSERECSFTSSNTPQNCTRPGKEI